MSLLDLNVFNILQNMNNFSILNTEGLRNQSKCKKALEVADRLSAPKLEYCIIGN